MKLSSWATGYYAKTYSELRSVYETIENILTLQWFCEARDIEFLICCVDHQKIRDERFHQNQAVRAMFEMVDQTRFLDFAVTDKSIHIDRAADGSHPGPESNEIFSGKLFDKYLEVQSSSEAPS